ncbi:hypothetical protein EV421DRAFT_779645 [Armillaria borealis]|uniref:Uncharacterized protein n=1 Tax=Armillaria borealis TaxID=47425 RepID=A0AA39JFU6_9AGAR|nr:hypothetical protein EV421DRAFT_779645 [Armillaria borealis]
MAREQLSGACRLFLRIAWVDLVAGVAGWAEAVVNTSSSQWRQEQSGYHPAGYQPTQQQQPQTPIYRPEATYAAGAGPIQFGNDLEYYSFEYGNGAVNGNGVVGSPGSADVDMLASIQALKNPEWWQGMLMPGFTWPQANSPGSGGSASSTPPATYSHVHHQNTYGAYQSTAG